MAHEYTKIITGIHPEKKKIFFSFFFSFSLQFHLLITEFWELSSFVNKMSKLDFFCFFILKRKKKILLFEETDINRIRVHKWIKNNSHLLQKMFQTFAFTVCLIKIKGKRAKKKNKYINNWEKLWPSRKFHFQTYDFNWILSLFFTCFMLEFLFSHCTFISSFRFVSFRWSSYLLWMVKLWWSPLSHTKCQKRRKIYIFSKAQCMRCRYQVRWLIYTHCVKWKQFNHLFLVHSVFLWSRFLILQKEKNSDNSSTHTFVWFFNQIRSLIFIQTLSKKSCNKHGVRSIWN